MKILFHENQLTYRGTSNAIYDYARYNEELLNNESVIIFNKNNKNNLNAAISKFKSRFEVIGYSETSELEKIVEIQNADLFYAIKSGQKDGVEVSNCKTAIHAVFKHCEPHGDIYAYVSEWLALEMTNGSAPFVPHMITVEKSKLSFRKELNIPDDAIVFGRHGGAKTFDLAFVKSVVKQVARQRKDIYFLFLGTSSFVFKTLFRPYKNIIFLPTTVDPGTISKFINTCDAYLHARKQGESFGIAIGEFSISNKPILTWADSHEKSHIDILGDKALLYNDQQDLSSLLKDFVPDSSKNWDAYSEKFSPTVVMDKFKTVFID